MSITGFKFMYGYEPYPELIGTPSYSYYTVQSNVFMGIVSFVFANREYQIYINANSIQLMKHYI